MQVRNNSQVEQDRSNSSGTDSTVANKADRSAIDRMNSEPTIAESLASGSTIAEQLSGQSPENRVRPDNQQSGLTDASARLGALDIGSIADDIKLLPPIVELQDKIETLEAKLETASSPMEYNLIGFQLNTARAELKAESLKLIEKELIRRNDTPRPDPYSAFEPIGTGAMTRADLEALAAGPEYDPLAIAARTILNEPGGFESIAGAGGAFTFPLPWGNVDVTSPSALSLDEIQAARLDAEKDIENVAETNDGHGDYEVPEGDDLTIGLTADEVEIGQIAFDAQQDAIEESIRTGEEVEFVNSLGNTVNVTVTPTPGNGTASYSVAVREGSEINIFSVNSEIGTENTIAGIANVVDWGSSLNPLNREGADAPAFPGTVNFRAESDPVAAAWANGPANTMNFYNGTANINKSTYIHEMGHFIGYALNNAETESYRSSPEGWEEVLASAEGDVSQYTVNPPEEFSEALAAYVNAADHGPEALAEFRAAFPDRAAYIEANILGPQEPVVEPKKPTEPAIYSYA